MARVYGQVKAESQSGFTATLPLQQPRSQLFLEKTLGVAFQPARLCGLGRWFRQRNTLGGDGGSDPGHYQRGAGVLQRRGALPRQP
jgi:hypothetical protein